MKKLLLRMIAGYQKRISPLFPPRCKYVPSCSAYAKEAIETFGVWKGCRLAVWRILRCNPFSKGGFDPVPQKKSGEKNERRL